MTEFVAIQRKLVQALLKIPVMQDFTARTRLLDGLPPVALSRSAGIAQLDLATMISELQMLGRLTDQGGIRPLIVVVDNALQFVPATGEVAAALNEVKQDLAELYGGEMQPLPAEIPAGTPEALIFGLQRDTRLPFAFIEGASRIARSIARLSVRRIFNGVWRQPEISYGTGWLIAPGLMITNHHVIDARDRKAPRYEAPAAPSDFQAQAEQIDIEFDYWTEPDPHSLKCHGATLVASDEQLDYALIRLTNADKIVDRQPLRIITDQPSLIRGDRLNIAQHPRGGPLQYAIRNNFYVQPGAAAPLLLYQTDTEPGASGSPVCNDQWQVVGLHHASVSTSHQQVPQEVVDGQPVTVKLLNEAITISAILQSLPHALKQQIMDAQHLDSRTLLPAQ